MLENALDPDVTSSLGLVTPSSGLSSQLSRSAVTGVPEPTKEQAVCLPQIPEGSSPCEPGMVLLEFSNCGLYVSGYNVVVLTVTDTADLEGTAAQSSSSQTRKCMWIPELLSKHRFLSCKSGGRRDSAFLTSSQALLCPLGGGPHFDSCGPRL